MNNRDLPTPPGVIFDTTLRPQDNFFGYVNNRWLESHPIPESETRWGTFNILRDEAWHAMRTIYEDLGQQKPAQGTIRQQARDFYFTGMHFDELEDAHLKQVADLHRQIDLIHTTSDLARVIGALHAIGINGPWHSYVDSDHDDSSKHIFHFRQSGLTLPSRDYYLDGSDKMRRVRKEYQAHATRVYKHFPGLADTSAAAWKTLMAFETSIATVSRSSADLRDVEKNYHKTTYGDLTKNYPAIDWTAYAASLGWRVSDQITVEQPEFMAFINAAITDRPLGEWKLYLKWRVICQTLSKISSRMADLHFEFFGRVLSGTSEIMPLWKRVVHAAEYTIGEGVGQLYTERHFPEASKQQVLEIVESVRDAYDDRLQNLDWMSEKTKTYARKKLQNIQILIGYPDSWRDFSTLTISRDSYVGNILEGQRHEVAYWLKRLHQPTSRKDWFMTPQTVNAYHDPNRLVICFPAGILQKPFFDSSAPLAINMGGIGTVIGHELTHGFDDQGCMFDASGNVRTWQTKKEREAFTQKAQIIVESADAFEVLPGLNLKGKLVLGESIADLGGLELALHALKKHRPSTEDIQAFFVNYAYSECASVREEKLREYTLTDPHPVSEFRVNGILQHIDDFYKAFDIKPGDTLYIPPRERAQIW
jgi:putative endopeptidase